ncbi:MAG: OmpA family protein [Elusimicrobia bacterium]|nr:OmpA family protein [Elusimicrobiota bacterium]
MPLRAPKGFIDETDPKVCQIGHPAPAWLVNYADLMTELVCFFVILYALSAALNKNVQNAAKEVQEMMDKGQMKGEVKIDQEGMRITLQEQGQVPFFSSGSADLTSDMEDKLSKLSPVLKKLVDKQDIQVEGHTDNQRISNEYFDSNWELSTSRATNVVRTMIDKFGFPPSRLAAIGYGEFRPVAPNDTPENRSKNRRVVFFVKNSPPKFEGGKAEGAGPEGAKVEGAKVEGAKAEGAKAGGEAPQEGAEAPGAAEGKEGEAATEGAVSEEGKGGEAQPEPAAPEKAGAEEGN